MNLKTSLQRYGEKQYGANKLIRNFNNLFKNLNNYPSRNSFCTDLQDINPLLTKR